MQPFLSFFARLGRDDRASTCVLRVRVAQTDFFIEVLTGVDVVGFDIDPRTWTTPAGRTREPGEPEKNRNDIMSAADKIQNAAEDLKGKAKEALGNLTNDDSKVAEGKADQAKADAKKAGENVKDAFKH
jgi:uncharacterized protein YjbJ (UPF0337 family)